MPRTPSCPHDQAADETETSSSCCFHCLCDSWSPLRAMAVRLRGDIGPGREFETLADYLFNESLLDIPCALLELCPRHLPRPGEAIRVFQLVQAPPKSPEVILPGAAVFTSVEHAQWVVECAPDVMWQLLETEVYPDELLTVGKPGHFIYVPRSVLTGYERHMRDTLRTQRQR